MQRRNSALEPKLPIQRLSSYEDEDDEFVMMHRIGDVVPNYGRGSLAKAVLLPYSVFLHCKYYDCRFPIESVDQIFHKGTMLIDHPFAYSAALGPMAATVHAYLMTASREDEWADEIVEENMIPWMKQPETVRNDVTSYPFMAKASDMGKYLIFDRTAP